MGTVSTDLGAVSSRLEAVLANLQFRCAVAFIFIQFIVEVVLCFFCILCIFSNLKLRMEDKYGSFVIYRKKAFVHVHALLNDIIAFQTNDYA